MLNKENFLKLPIENMKGIGKVRASKLNKIGIYCVLDLLYYFPRDYQDRTSFKKISELKEEDENLFIGTIASKVVEFKTGNNLTLSKIAIKDETSKITAFWYNQRHIKNIFKPNESYVFFGEIIKNGTSLEVHNPTYYSVKSHDIKDLLGIFPIYNITEGLTQNIIRKVVKNILEKLDNNIKEYLPNWIVERFKLLEVNEAIKNIHFPKSFKVLEQAKSRLIFDELLMLQLGLFSVKNIHFKDKLGISFKPCNLDEIKNNLGFKLTNAQVKVFEEINNDMEQNKIMNRLLQGDVGSGKTVVALLAIYKAVKSGYQVAFMVPTEILARQHFDFIKKHLEVKGINVQILIGGIKKSTKNRILDGLKLGTIDVIIGTHALIEENVDFNLLGLVITDEQHRFGVRQRARLNKKGQAPDVLVMTATPIPRTLALILYGDLDISIIDELPPGRKPIKTYVVDHSTRKRVNNFIKKTISNKGQVYIVCPLIEESAKVNAVSSKEVFEEYTNGEFKDYKVALMHGKINAFEKETVMSEFIKGNIDILISTTVIEVGVNVPNASLMIIENAERFGLAQLHQLRGRVGRGENQSFCILYNNGNSKISKERMKVLERTTDGFVISEKDMELRGTGEFFGTRQHGIMPLKIANLYNDIEVLKKVQNLSKEIIYNDYKLESEEFSLLKEELVERFFKKMKDITLN